MQYPSHVAIWEIQIFYKFYEESNGTNCKIRIPVVMWCTHFCLLPKITRMNGFCVWNPSTVLFWYGSWCCPCYPCRCVLASFNALFQQQVCVPQQTKVPSSYLRRYHKVAKQQDRGRDAQDCVYRLCSHDWATSNCYQMYTIQQNEYSSFV